MPSKPKFYPKTIFDEEIVAGDKIIYLVHSGSMRYWCWATVKTISWPETPTSHFYAYMPFVIRAEKYAELGAYSKNEDLPKMVTLTAPICLLVGGTIPENPK